MSSDNEEQMKVILSRGLDDVRDDILACFERGRRHRLFTIVNRYFRDMPRFLPYDDRENMTRWLEALLFELEKESAVIHEEPEGRLEVFWMLATPEHVERIEAARAKQRAEMERWERDNEVLKMLCWTLSRKGVPAKVSTYGAGSFNFLEIKANAAEKLLKLLGVDWNSEGEP
ncbi:MAG: hypothetical protein ACYTE0_13120 [Planctomycetota bacterium]|jgi:hypothetical protein